MNNEVLEIIDCFDEPVFVLAPGADGEPTYVALNAAGLRAGGLEIEQVLGRTAQEIFPGRFGQRAYENHKYAILSGRPHSYQLAFTRDDEAYTVRTTLTPIKDSSGKVYRLFGITSFIDREYRQQQALAAAIAHNSAMEHFISLAAHDLRSPIRNIKLLSELIKTDLTDMGDGKLQQIEMLEQVADKANTLIGDLVSYAQTTGVTESIENFELADLVHEVMGMLDPEMHHRCDAQRVALTTDKFAVQIILRNLIDNAIKHNPAPVQIAVEAEAIASGHVEFAVENSGALLDNPRALFDARPGCVRAGGFGLLAVKRLVHTRGGAIEAHAPDGDRRGLRVVFSLPGETGENPREAAVAG